MRTTLDLPDELLKRAKIEAVERGTSLRDLVGAALERELNRPPEPKPMRKRALKQVLLDTAAPTGIAVPARGNLKLRRV